MILFPISRDPPEGGTELLARLDQAQARGGFQFLGIPPKGEQICGGIPHTPLYCFQFLGIPPKGERIDMDTYPTDPSEFPISRDPPEGGTSLSQ